MTQWPWEAQILVLLQTFEIFVEGGRCSWKLWLLSKIPVGTSFVSESWLKVQENTLGHVTNLTTTYFGSNFLAKTYIPTGLSLCVLHYLNWNFSSASISFHKWLTVHGGFKNVDALKFLIFLRSSQAALMYYFSLSYTAKSHPKRNVTHLKTFSRKSFLKERKN